MLELADGETQSRLSDIDKSSDCGVSVIAIMGLGWIVFVRVLKRTILLP